MKIQRRQILQAAGVSLALPCFDAFSSARAADAETPKRRMVCICTPLGLHPENFIPQETGENYSLSPYLESLKDYRHDFTVISGLSHAGVSPGFAHQATASFLTGVPGAGRPGFRNGISLDQFAAEHIGSQTRFPALTLSSQGLGLSWSRTGAQIPAANSPSSVFAKMFLAGALTKSGLRFVGFGIIAAFLTTFAIRQTRCGPASVLTTGKNSTSTSPACVSWSSDLLTTKPGTENPNRV